MPNVTKIQLPSGTTYDIKDTTSGYITGGTVTITTSTSGVTNYTPEGSNSTSNVTIVPATSSISTIDSVGETPVLTFSPDSTTKKLTIFWDQGTVPTTGSTTVMTGVTSATAAAQTFNGTSTRIAATFNGVTGESVSTLSDADKF